MVVDASAETDQTHARLHTEMVAEHNLKISSNKAATALQETRWNGRFLLAWDPLCHSLNAKHRQKDDK